MLEKFQSRKFLMALLSVVLGIMTLFGVAETSIEVVSSVGLVLIPTIVYIFTEGKIDAAGVKQITSTIDDIVDVVDKKE